MLPEEITRFVGTGGDPRILVVEKGAISRLAEAIEDQNPLYWDEEYASKSRYGSIIAPPGWFGRPAKPQLARESSAPDLQAELTAALAKAGYSRLLAGGTEFEQFRPVRVGDILVSSSRTKEFVEREGRLGKMVFVINETTIINQNGDLVAKTRGTTIRY